MDVTSAVTELIHNDLPGYLTYRPRPDQADRYDEQESFYNSESEGVVFHIGGNGSGTSENALAKVAKFVLRDQEPPRKDTPFWIIAGSYEQVMEACWAEKLYGHGHIPDSEVDWERVVWKSHKSNWPYRVPLKPWPGLPGRNWLLEFKSYEQGRGQFQARAIGGFCFVEQFPYVLLSEVLRGCREYSFKGSKLCEFTPVDPHMTYDIQRMIETDTLPLGWEVWRANTACNLEAGHISKEWFDQFYASIPEDMLETRMTGAFAGYEGLIYETFNPRVHVVGDDVIDFPQGVYHYRGIDWGAGPNNAFVCVWAYINGMGEVFVYDEYHSTSQRHTTVDHMVEVQDRWPWPENNPYYSSTFADPSSPDNIRISQKLSQYTNGKYENVQGMMRGANAVLEGIEHVQWLLKKNEQTDRPRLFIHESCANLIRGMRTYSWLRSSEMGLNPQDARPEPLKKDDHACDALRYLTFSVAQMRGTNIQESIKRPVRSMHGIQFNRGQ
ncbi:hypothetical protein K0U83_21430 [bacterium]|nr:hypothetical protein [bacterium]